MKPLHYAPGEPGRSRKRIRYSWWTRVESRMPALYWQHRPSILAILMVTPLGVVLFQLALWFVPGV